MLVLSRKPGKSIMIGDAIKITVITVLENKAVLKIGSETKTVEQGKEIPIAEDITLMLTSICENKVRLGITAPKQVSVRRREIYDAIKREETQT